MTNKELLARLSKAARNNMKEFNGERFEKYFPRLLATIKEVVEEYGNEMIQECNPNSNIITPTEWSYLKNIFKNI